MQALEVQTQGLLAFVQQLGEKQGWRILAQLLPPLRPPPPPHRESTPVSPLSVLMLSVKPSVGLRAGFVDSTFVPGSLICRPSWRKCGCPPSCRPSCRFWKPPHVEEVQPKFSTFFTTWIFILLLMCNFFFFSGTRGRRQTIFEGRRGRTSGHPQLEHRLDPSCRELPTDSFLCIALVKLE
jgi:hypothetical protein